MCSWTSEGNTGTGSSKENLGRARREKAGERSLCECDVFDVSEERTTAGERDRVNVERPWRTVVALESPDELGRSIGNGFFSMGFFVCEKVRPRKAAGNSSSSVSSSELLRDAELKAWSEEPRKKMRMDGRA